MKRKRRGLTLLEVVLVMAILVVVATMSTPVWRSMLESSKLRKSGDLLRSALAQARTRAMTKGRVYMFRYQTNDRGYITQPWYADSDIIESSEATVGISGVATMQVSQDEETTRQIPDGVTFQGSEIVSDLRSATIDSEMSSTLSGDVTWSAPILFYPDGSSSNARIILVNKRQKVVTVELRGLTGLSKATPVQRMEDLAEYAP